MNTLAENVLYIYLIVFVSILFFDVVCIFYRKANDKRMRKLEKKFKKLIDKEDVSNVCDKHKNKLRRKLKRTSNLISFTNVVEKMDEKDREEYLSSLKVVFLSLVPYYEKRDVVLQTYFVNFLMENSYIYSDNNNIIIKYLKDCCLTPLIYLRENALNAFYNISNITYLKEIFYNMNYMNIRHNSKLITDGLMKFSGDTKDLSSMLLGEFVNYNENFKVACINYFSYKKVKCEEEIYNLLANKNENQEVRIACIRYFGSVSYKKVVPLLYDFLNDSVEEYAVVSAHTLSNYKGADTTEALINALKSHNWYVRNNAAESLIKVIRIDYIKRIIDKLDDKYAKEALKYQLHLSGKEV